MANTHKTNKGRIARALNRKHLSIVNSDSRENLNQVQTEIGALGVNGRRYGNHRKMKAKEKVSERRAERKTLNCPISPD